MDQQSLSVIQSLEQKRGIRMKLMCKESSRASGPAKVRTQLSLCTAPQGKNTTYLLIKASLLEMTALHSNARLRLWLRRKQRHIPSSPSPACWTGQKFSPVSGMEIKNRKWLNPRALTGCLWCLCCTKAKTAHRWSCLGCNKLICKITCLLLFSLLHLPSQKHPSRSFPPFPILEQVLVCRGQCSVSPSGPGFSLTWAAFSNFALISASSSWASCSLDFSFWFSDRALSYNWNAEQELN